jgi:hypothetical protein
VWVAKLPAGLLHGAAGVPARGCNMALTRPTTALRTPRSRTWRVFRALHDAPVLKCATVPCRTHSPGGKPGPCWRDQSGGPALRSWCWARTESRPSSSAGQPRRRGSKISPSLSSRQVRPVVRPAAAAHLKNVQLPPQQCQKGGARARRQLRARHQSEHDQAVQSKEAHLDHGQQVHGRLDLIQVVVPLGWGGRTWGGVLGSPWRQRAARRALHVLHCSDPGATHPAA